MRLPGTAEGAGNDACLTRADHAPEGIAEIPELERCATLVPHDAELLSDLAGLYATAGQADKAEASYRRVIAIDPDHAIARMRLAALLLAAGKATEAREHAQHALRVQPNRRAILDLLEQADRMEQR